MTGRRKSITWKLRQEALLAAIIASPSYARAAKAVGCSERTLRRLMKRPAFARRVAEARKAALTAAVGSLTALSSEAFDAIRRALTCGVPAIELRAGLAVLLDGPVRGGEFLFGLAELEELRAQVELLLEQQKELEAKNRDQ